MQLERIDDLALLRINTGKGNSMRTETFHRLNEILDDVDDARALVITGHEQFFSAGLALPEIIDFDRDALADFIDLFSDTMMHVFTLPMPVVAAINGHAIAGGAVLALQTDYRIMAAECGQIGLNEIQLGLGMTPQVIESLRIQVPVKSVQPIALEGRLMNTAEALELGLLDEVVAADKLESRAIEKARHLSSHVSAAVAQIKHTIRRHAINRINATRRVDHGRWLDIWFTDETQAILRATVAKIQNK